MNFPSNLRYTKEHEWIRMEDKMGVIGISDFAQDQLGDVVFVELPEIGRTLKASEAMGVVESVKTVSDIFCPVEGKVIEVNKALNDQPEIINSDPYEKGWMVKIEVMNPDAVGDLLDHQAYEALTQES